MVKELNADNFKEFISGKPVIIDFWASWCGPCKMMAPVFEDSSKEYKEKLEFAKLSTEDFPQIAEEIGITGIPCLIIFKDGKEVDRIVGFQQKESLNSKIEAIFSRL